jgi:hypothetical protein
VEGFCEHGNEPPGSINVGKFLSNCATGSFSRRAQLHGVSKVELRLHNGGVSFVFYLCSLHGRHYPLHCEWQIPSKSKSRHGQSVSSFWCRDPSGPRDQILFLVFNLSFCRHIRRVCPLSNVMVCYTCPNIYNFTYK